jgi:urease accessory protein
MLKAERVVMEAERVDDTLTLPFELRQKSRLVATLGSGRQIQLQLPRGKVLRHGALLSTNEGSTVQIRSAPETLSVVKSKDPVALARAAYHLGNRHVSLQIDENGLSYLHDHVLDDMLRGLGLTPSVVESPFEPEPGAYAHGAAAYDAVEHEHDHDHEDHGSH